MKKNTSRPLRRLVGGLAMIMKLLEWWPCSARKTGAGVQEAWFVPMGGSNSRIESARNAKSTYGQNGKIYARIS